MNIGDRVIVRWAGDPTPAEVIGFDRDRTVVRIGDGWLYQCFTSYQITPLEPDCTVPEGLEVVA